MNQKNQRIFLLYYSGYTWIEIGEAVKPKMTGNGVRSVIHKHGHEWVNEYLKMEYRLKLLKLSSEGKTSQEIADEMKWNRWLVIFTLRRMDAKLWPIGAALKRDTLTEDISPPKQYVLRCPICTAQFVNTTQQLLHNPDRICSTCEDRRVEDRRKLNRSKDADDATGQSSG